MDSTSSSVIEVQDLAKTYRSGLIFRSRVHALKGINLRVTRGQIFGLLGPNGAGKTTLVKILLGIIRPNQGSAKLFNEPNWRQSVRQKIGYLPEHFHVARHHTAVTSLYFLGRLSRMRDSQIHARIPELMELVGLRGRENELVRTYSKGMKQRLGLAQALLHEPELLFLDEPTDGLDPLGRHHIRQCIERLRDAGKTIFVNSHILQEVEQMCDQFAIMAKGAVLADGTIDELLVKLNADQVAVTYIEAYGKEPQLTQVQMEYGAPTFEYQRMKVDGPRSNGNASTDDSPPVMAKDESANGDLSWQLKLASNEQADVDRLVDLLRASGLSIINMARRQPSLEQVFLHFVQQSESEQARQAS